MTVKFQRFLAHQQPTLEAAVAAQQTLAAQREQAVLAGAAMRVLRVEITLDHQALLIQVVVGEVRLMLAVHLLVAAQAALA